MHTITPLNQDTTPGDFKARLDALFAAFPTEALQSQTEMALGWLLEAQPKLALFPKETGPVFIDFTAGKKNHRRQFGGGKSQPMARAVGMGNPPIPRILDATAGMGGDAFVFATLGCQVQMVERSPVVSALLEDAINRGLADESLTQDIQQAVQNLSLVCADSANYCLQEKPICDVVYMDPMYPEKKKAASAKKEMKALQQLVGPDLDSEKLLQAALETALLRVVVKRPAKAPIIELASKIVPTSQIKSPNTRYDVYSIKALRASKKLM